VSSRVELRKYKCHHLSSDAVISSVVCPFLRCTGNSFLAKVYWIYSMFENIALKIRRRESPFYDRLYRIAKATRRIEIYPLWPVYHVLSLERSVRLQLWGTFARVFYYTPLFKLRCNKIGKRFLLMGGMPLVIGNLRLNIGSDVSMHGYSTLAGAKVFDEPTLHVGNNTHLGYQLVISVGCDITIGDDVLIGERVSLLSYDGHPSNPKERHLPAPKESSRPIVIGNNVWIGACCTILKGVTIGEGSVIANGSVVTTRVPVNSIAIGNPARCFPMMLNE
jgi:acetyltransferase-like isoleucine patch superfamily enzyme